MTVMPAHRSGTDWVLPCGWRGGGMPGGMAASSFCPAAAGGCCSCAAWTLVPAMRSHRLAARSASDAPAGKPACREPVRESCAVQAASWREQAACALHLADRFIALFVGHGSGAQTL